MHNFADYIYVLINVELKMLATMATKDGTLLYGFLLFIWFMVAILVHYFLKKSQNSENLIRYPPSPLGLPIIGHLHLLGPNLQRSLQTLAHKYGPLMKLQFGITTCTVVSNSDLAKEILRTNELDFVYRPKFSSKRYNLFDGCGFVTAPYGAYWRFMKKLCMTRLLSTSQLNQFVHIRQEEITKLLESLTKVSKDGEFCDIKMKFMTMTNNLICRMGMSTSCAGNDDEAKEIRMLIDDILILVKKISTIGQVFGDALDKYDVFGYGEKVRKFGEKFDKLVEKIMKEHEGKSCEREEGKDLMDILLEIHGDPHAEMKLSRKDIKAFFLDIFIAATDSTSIAPQWALAELINHPKVLNKLRQEINSVVGPTRLVKESDVPNLPYLQSVAMETLRLHPPAPLIFRECNHDCKINGYDVKSKSMVIVNSYAIMRDPESWANPEEFVPERFMVRQSTEENPHRHQMDIKGQNFNYLPFGSGRRGCPGASLALTVMHMTIAALVQCFDWKVKGREKVDLSEGSGFSMGLAHPFECYPILIFNPFAQN